MSETNTVIEPRNSAEALRAPRLSDIPVSVLLFLASRASVFGAFPFGAAMFAACFDKSAAYIGVAVVCLGLVTSGAGNAVIKYLIAVLLFWIFTRIKTPPRMNRRILESIACGASVLIGGAAVMAYSYIGMYEMIMLFMESLISAIMYIIFLKAQRLLADRKKRTQAAQDEIISVAVALGVFITGMRGISLPYGIDIADIFASYAVMCMALHGGLAAAGSGGLCIGFMSAMAESGAPVMMGVYGLNALFGSLLKSFGRFGAALGFLGGTAIAMLYARGTNLLPLTIYEALIAAILFAATPRRVHGRIGAFFSKSLQIEAVNTEERIKEYLSMRLERTSNAFRSLEECFCAASDKRLKMYGKDAGAIFDELARRVCADCSMAQKCWQSEFTKTYRSVMTMLDTIETDGSVTAASAPQSFRERCIHKELFVLEFGHVYELYKKNMIRTGEAVMGRDLAARQYREMSELMDTMSREISEGFVFREDMEETAVNELDKHGITPREISVIEGGKGRLEIYLSVSLGTSAERVADILTMALETPIGYESVAQSGLLKFASKPRYTVDIGTRQLSRDDSEISGDSMTVFTTDDYKLYAILSDGMGSGREALMESHITLRLLREFLQSGFGIRTAINIINSALCLKLDSECFSTVDLLCIDLMTGIADFYKIGGAESYIYTGGGVETVFSVSLPVGMLPDVKIQGQMKKLGDGDIVMMLSDGITEAGYGRVRTEWLKKKIKMPYDTMDALADDVITAAVQKSHNEITDDMSVAAIRLVESV